MEKTLAVAAAAISLESTTPTIASHADAAPSSHCSSSRKKVVLSYQPDQAYAQATCNPLQTGHKFKAILTSNKFPNAVSEWRTTAGTVKTGTRPWFGSTGSDVQTAKI